MQKHGTVLSIETRKLFGESSEAIRVLDLVFNDEVMLQLESAIEVLFGSQRRTGVTSLRAAATFALRAIAANIRTARVARGWTQQDLADRSGINRANIARLEAAKHVPRIDSLAALAEVLSLPLGSMLETSISAAQLRMRNEAQIRLGVDRVKRSLREMQQKGIVDEKGELLDEELPQEMVDGTSESI